MAPAQGSAPEDAEGDLLIVRDTENRPGNGAEMDMALGRVVGNRDPGTQRGTPRVYQLDQGPSIFPRKSFSVVLSLVLPFITS